MPIRSSNVNVLSVYPNNCFLKLKGETTQLFYGVELETNLIYGAETHIEEIEASFEKRAIIKPDNGCEIVTVPATLLFHKEHMWNAYFNGPVKFAAKDQHGAGLHIHLSRDGVTDMQLAKFICFIHAGYNKDFISNIAGRTIDEMRVFYRSKIINNKNGIKDILDVQARMNKYEAVHISRRNNFKTAEVRIFQSVPTKQAVFQALEFVDCLLQYLATNGNIEEEITYQKFIEWFHVTNKYAEYPYLNNNLVRLKYFSSKDEVVIDTPEKGVA